MSAIQQIAMALAVAGIGAGQGLAQEGAGAARRAAARMEEQAQASMLLLGQARQQYSEGKYQEALDNYRRSLTALPKSPNMEKRRRFLETSIADASVAVAQEYIKAGRYDEAVKLLEDALTDIEEPEGDVFYWIACESGRARLMRKFLEGHRQVPKEWIRATGYWKADPTAAD